MKAIKGIYDNGRLSLLEPGPEAGPVEVLVVFPETDPWEHILNDAAPRPVLDALVRNVEAEIKAGKTTALDLSQL